LAGRERSPPCPPQPLRGRACVASACYPPPERRTLNESSVARTEAGGRPSPDATAPGGSCGPAGTHSVSRRARKQHSQTTSWVAGTSSARPVTLARHLSPRPTSCPRRRYGVVGTMGRPVWLVQRGQWLDGLRLHGRCWPSPGSRLRSRERVFGPRRSSDRRGRQRDQHPWCEHTLSGDGPSLGRFESALAARPLPFPVRRRSILLLPLRGWPG